MKTFYFNLRRASLVITGLLFIACSRDDAPNVAELPNNADFSYSIDQEEDPFTVHFNNESESYHSSYWQFGDGSEFSTEDSPSHTFPSGGTYRVTLAVQGDGNGGEIRRDVEIIDPALQGERIEDGNFLNEDAWNVTEAGEDILTSVAFTDSGLNVSNAGDGVSTNVVIWQEIEVEAGTEYFFTAHVEGGGMDQAWVEFHLSNEEPEGDDYAANNMWSLNTWGGCGEDPFEGDVVEISCNGNGDSDGLYTFEEGGIAYIVIKAGSWEGDLGPEGVTISNVSLMPADDVE